MNRGVVRDHVLYEPVHPYTGARPHNIIPVSEVNYFSWVWHCGIWVQVVGKANIHGDVILSLLVPRGRWLDSAVLGKVFNNYDTVVVRKDRVK